MHLLERYRSTFGRTLTGLDADAVGLGMSLLRAGRVGAVSEPSAGMLAGEVTESDGRRITLRIDLPMHDGRTAVASICECGAARPCGHAAGVLGRWLEEQVLRAKTTTRGAAVRMMAAKARPASSTAVVWPSHAFSGPGTRRGAAKAAEQGDASTVGLVDDAVEDTRPMRPAAPEAGAHRPGAWPAVPRTASAGRDVGDAADASRHGDVAAPGPDGAVSTDADGGFERVRVLDWVRALPRPASAPSGTRQAWRVSHVLSLKGPNAWLRSYRSRVEPGGTLVQPEPLPWAREVANPTASVFDATERTVWPWLQRETVEDGAILLQGTGVASALIALADAGRLHLDEPPSHWDTPPLRVGEPRTGRAEWVQDGEDWRLSMTVETGGIAIRSDRPCYLDRDAMKLGPLRSSLDEATMRWLRAAPVVPPALIADAAAALQARRLAHVAVAERVPAVPNHEVRERAVTPVPVLGLFASSAAEARGHGAAEFIVVSVSMEYDGRRVEPLRSPVIETRGDDGPELIRCDPVAEKAAVERLRTLLTTVSDGTVSLQNEGGDSNARGVRSGWLTMGAVPAGGVPAARFAHELIPQLQGEGWQVIDRRPVQGDTPLPPLLTADRVVVDAVADRPLVAGRDLRTVKVVGDGRDVALARDEEGKAHDATAEGNAAADWFTLQAGVMIGDQRIDLAPILADIVEAGSYESWAEKNCPDGYLWIEVLPQGVARIDARRIETLARTMSDWGHAGGMRFVRSGSMTGAERTLPPIDAFALAQLARRIENEDFGDVIEVPPALRDLRKTLEEFEGLETTTISPDFTATLRPYQQQGLDWLQWLAKSNLGGVLADDMGLGKTVQMLAHLDVERAAGRLDRPALVISPTSLVFNWMAEAKKHAPKLRVLDLTGPTRSMRFETIPEHDLVLTSYALLARDAEQLAEHEWHMVALDEAQTIKNARTRAAVGARRLRARHRVALTGTPLENHLGELWSIMQFALPGLLGNDESFRQRFRAPIERMAGTPVATERLQALDRRIRPFLLRRTKDAVLTDLPPRTDITHRVEIGGAQRELYESIRVLMDERVREALKMQGDGRQRIVILDALLKLRQACCDPALVKLPQAANVTESAKRDALVELLSTLMEEGRKALVFSQFTSMLDLIETALDADPELSKIPRSRLDGETADRSAEVARFQEGPAQIFLLSLRAGGVGLNLTAADTVIHYDPWWNPAVERQATDRAHRIGQDKPVFVYKLIAAGTVEERIAALQERKSALIESVLSGGLPADHRLTPDDLMGLFDPF